MISSTPLFPPTPSYLSGPQNPQPDGSFTLTANDDTGAVFTVKTDGALDQAPKGTAGDTEKMFLNPGGGSVNVYAHGQTFCYQYDGKVA